MSATAATVSTTRGAVFDAVTKPTPFRGAAASQGEAGNAGGVPGTPENGIGRTSALHGAGCGGSGVALKTGMETIEVWQQCGHWKEWAWYIDAEREYT